MQSNPSRSAHRSKWWVLLLSLGVTVGFVPTVMAGFDADCGVDPAPFVRANCGRIDSQPASNCIQAQGGISCSPSYAATITITSWINAGSVSASLSGDCGDSASASWPGPIVALTLPLACNAPTVFIPAGTCHTFTETVTASFGGSFAPRTLSTPEGSRICVGG